MQSKLPVWLGVGGTPASFVRAGALGLPLMVAVIGGETHRFRPLVNLYREAGKKAGHAPEKLKVGLLHHGVDDIIIHRYCFHFNCCHNAFSNRAGSVYGQTDVQAHGGW